MSFIKCWIQVGYHIVPWIHIEGQEMPNFNRNVSKGHTLKGFKMNPANICSNCAEVNLAISSPGGYTKIRFVANHNNSEIGLKSEQPIAERTTEGQTKYVSLVVTQEGHDSNSLVEIHNHFDCKPD